MGNAGLISKNEANFQNDRNFKVVDKNVLLKRLYLLTRIPRQRSNCYLYTYIKMIRQNDKKHPTFNLRLKNLKKSSYY